MATRHDPREGRGGPGAGSRQTLRARPAVYWDNSAPSRTTPCPGTALLHHSRIAMATRSSVPPSKANKVPMPAAQPAPATVTAANAALKLRQTQAEYVAARPAGEPGVKPMMSSSKMYVCRRCQANFKTGDGKPDSRLPGLGKCNKCLAAAAASALAA